MRSAGLAVILALLLLLPVVRAEFGVESQDGWPVNVNGEEVRPPFAPVVAYAAAQPLNKVGPFTVYPYYPILTAEVQRLASDHPDLVKLTSAGKSTLGLDLWLLEIADFKNPDMIPLEEREVIYLDGGTHSNEYSGVYFNTEIAQFLLDEYATNETAKWIVENRHTFILPMVNPDGSNAFGRLNAKTVNINRNFPATWGAVEEDPIVNNPGPTPGSEPETKIVMGILDKIQPDYVNSIHCCGNLWLHPWGAEQLPLAADFDMFTRICDDVFADVRKQCGPIWSTIYPASGTTADEGYNRTGASSWTYEMSGRGAILPWAQPLTTDDVRVQERESWGGVMHALLNVEKYGAHPKILSILGDANNLRVTIMNDGYGNLTGGNLTVNGNSVAFPFMAPNSTVELAVPGSYQAGQEPVLEMSYTKRILLAPQGRIAPAVTLVPSGGGLMGILSGETPIDSLSTPPAQVPAPSIFLVVAAVALALLVRRHRRAN